MKKNLKLIIMLFTVSMYISSCAETKQKENHDEHAGHDDHHGHEKAVHFTEQQFKTVGIIADTIPLRNISNYVNANGQLEVPPQNEAAVTAILGGNIMSIQVIEGDKINKGQVLAYLSHPNLIKIQTDYVNSYNKQLFLEQEYFRQKKLLEEKIGSGKAFQKIEAEYNSNKGMVRGYEAQLKLMGLDVKQLQKSNIYEQVPVISPIEGYVKLVNVKTGQYVQPQKTLFEIVNINHIHADLMVFEKDMHKVKVGQKVVFSIESLPGEELSATIYSVGKAFEQDPKAIHLHAEIDNKSGLLIPGMYVRARINTEGVKHYALPEDAIVREGSKSYIFTAKMKKEHGETKWVFKPIEVSTGFTDDGWVEITRIEPLKKGTQVLHNKAYYIMADLKKEEAEHSH